MIKYYSNHKLLIKDFKDKRINTSLVGFQYSKEFMEAETRETEYLHNYARFVDTYPYDDCYLLNSKQEIEFISKIIYDEFSKKPRDGACVDLSLFLSRVLEIEGHWNYIVKGSLKLEFDNTLNIPDRYFWHVDKADVVAGHAWVCAAPFKVIDLSIQHQNFSDDAVKFLPKYLIEIQSKKYTPLTSDIFCPEAIHYYQQEGIHEAQIMSTLNNGMKRFIKTFRSHQIELNKVTFNYIPLAIAAADNGDLETFNNLIINNMSPFQFYTQVIKPSLLEFRSKY